MEVGKSSRDEVLLAETLVEEMDRSSAAGALGAGGKAGEITGWGCRGPLPKGLSTGAGAWISGSKRGGLAQAPSARAAKLTRKGVRTESFKGIQVARRVGDLYTQGQALCCPSFGPGWGRWGSRIVGWRGTKQGPPPHSSQLVKGPALRASLGGPGEIPDLPQGNRDCSGWQYLAGPRCLPFLSRGFLANGRVLAYYGLVVKMKGFAGGDCRGKEAGRGELEM